MNPKRLNFIDALRGIAAFSVCVQHIAGEIIRESDSTGMFYWGVTHTVTDYLDLGRFGVVLFFLISGFIIPFSLKPQSTLIDFSISRLFRLYPAYWFTLGVLFIFQSYLGYSEFSLRQLLANISMMPKLFHQDDMSGVFWTLFVELLFYFGCAFLFYIKKLDDVVIITLIATTLNLSTSVPVVINYLFGTHLPVQFLLFHLSFLFLGSLLKLAIVEHEKKGVRLLLLVSVVFIFGVLTVPGLLFEVREALGGFVMFKPLAVVVAYFLAVSVFLIALTKNVPTSKFWVNVGLVSYSLYLLHMIAFDLVSKFIHPVSSLSTFLYILIAFGFAYFVASISYKYIEVPAVKMGRILIKWNKQ